MLMCAVMTYNAGIFAAACLGLFTSYTLLAFSEAKYELY